jgi:hypothetical protein
LGPIKRNLLLDEENCKAKKRVTFLSESFGKEVGGFPTVMPVKTGIQEFGIFWIPGRTSYRQLARNDGPILNILRKQYGTLPMLTISND